MKYKYNVPCKTCGKNRIVANGKKAYLKRSPNCRRCAWEKNWKQKSYRKKQMASRKTLSFIESRSGANNPKWKGDTVGYFALHDWVKSKLGTPTKCEHCGKDGLMRSKINWANKSGKYKRDLKDWLRLCVKCHRKYDK